MNKDEYLKILKEHLEYHVSQNELNDILADYESFFISATEEGQTESSVIDSLGAPDILAQGILAEKESELELEYTSPGKRLAAFMIDALVAIVPITLFSLFRGVAGFSVLLFMLYPAPLSGAIVYSGIATYSSFTETSTSRIIMEDESGITLTEVIEEPVGDKHNVISNTDGLIDINSPLAPIIQISSIIAILFYLLYASIATVCFHTTLGKKLMHINVCTSQLGPIGKKDAIIREFVGKVLINSIPFVPLISLFTITFTKKNQAIHDMILNTIVLDKKI